MPPNSLTASIAAGNDSIVAPLRPTCPSTTLTAAAPCTSVWRRSRDQPAARSTSATSGGSPSGIAATPLPTERPGETGEVRRVAGLAHAIGHHVPPPNSTTSLLERDRGSPADPCLPSSGCKESAAASGHR